MKPETQNNYVNNDNSTVTEEVCNFGEQNFVVKTGNPNDKTEVTLSGDPQQQIDSKGLVGESESAKLEMEFAKIINESSLDHELEKEEIEEVDINESKPMERRAELASLPEASFEDENRIKGQGNLRIEKIDGKN